MKPSETLPYIDSKLTAILDEHHARLAKLEAAQVSTARIFGTEHPAEQYRRMNPPKDSPAEPRTDDAVEMLRELCRVDTSSNFPWRSGAVTGYLEPIIAAIEAERASVQQLQDYAAEAVAGEAKMVDALAAEKRAHEKAAANLDRQSGDLDRAQAAIGERNATIADLRA